MWKNHFEYTVSNIAMSVGEGVRSRELERSHPAMK